MQRRRWGLPTTGDNTARQFPTPLQGFRLQKKASSRNIILMLMLMLILLALGALALMAAVPLDLLNEDVIIMTTLRRSKEAIKPPKLRVRQHEMRMLTTEFGNTLNRSRTVVVTPEGCSCELISLDCLSCIRHLPRQEGAQKYTALGVLTRQVIKDMARFDLDDDRSPGWDPIGKATQYTAITNWGSWVWSNQLPPRLDPKVGSVFVDESLYPDCVRDGQPILGGRSCFFSDFNADEDMEEVEVEAMARTHTLDNRTIIDALRMDVSAFQGRANRKEYDKVPALGYLLAFAHMTKISFNLRPHMTQIYEQRLESVHNIDPHGDGNLRVGLHLRRADSCDLSSYKTEASQLDSVAQVGGKRMCYNTSVYVDALQKVQVLAQRSIDVYLSTDESGSILKEIKRDYPSVYQGLNWRFLNYDRDLFEYEGVIEGDKVEKNQQALLGEAAVSDLFHLSKMDVFIGHLGSRFGKMSWLLATARRNTFVPFFSVDGHSVCCEVDEVCSDAQPYISNMDSCLTFVHALSSLEMNKDYWEVGSKLRMIAWQKEKGKQKRTRMHVVLNPQFVPINS